MVQEREMLTIAGGVVLGVIALFVIGMALEVFMRWSDQVSTRRFIARQQSEQHSKQ